MSNTLRLKKLAALFLIVSLPAVVGFGGFPLSIELPGNTRPSRLQSLKLKKTSSLETTYHFQFDRPVAYEINWDANRKQLWITFDQVTRHHFRRSLDIAHSHLHRVSLARSRSRQYRIEFQLRDDVMPLPFSSSGTSAEVKLGFRFTRNPESGGEKIRESLRQNEGLAISHLSSDYKPLTKQTSSGPKRSEFAFYRAQQIDSHVKAFRFRTKSLKGSGFGFILDREAVQNRFRIVQGGSSGMQIRHLSELSSEARALVSINGSYFMANGDPLGLLITKGKLVSTPILDRACFGLLQDGTPHVGHARFTGWLHTKGLLLSIEGYNQDSDKDKTLLFSREYGRKSPQRKGTVQYVILDNRITDVSMEPIEIPQNGYVLSVSPRKLPLDKTVLKIQEEVELEMRLSSPWNKMQWAVGGGPRLVRKGKIATDMQSEGFSQSFLTTRAPRTGVGFDANGNLIFMVVDGRQNHSPGLNIVEFAKAMQNAGAIEAINLDGGGSTTAWFDGMIVNNPSDGSERKIANALMILPTKS